MCRLGCQTVTLLDTHPTLLLRFNRMGWDVIESGCWEWKGSRHVRGGYGQISGTRATGPLKAHRVAYEISFGEVPEGMMVCHRCDNPPCVNPDHLFAGSGLDNIQDCWNKGRGKHMVMAGEACPASKLTWASVHEIRDSTDSLSALAARYGVSKQAISKVKKGQTWKKKSSFTMQ